MHKVGQDPDHSTCMYGYNARHNNTGVLPTVVHLSYHAPRGRCVRLYAQRRCGARDTGGAARARATLACEPFRHNTRLVSRGIRICVRMSGARARKGGSGKNTYGVNDRFLCVRGMQLTHTSQRSHEVYFGWRGRGWLVLACVRLCECYAR